MEGWVPRRTSARYVEQSRALRSRAALSILRPVPASSLPLAMFVTSPAASPAIWVLPFWTKKVTRFAAFFRPASDGRDLKADFLGRVFAPGGLFSSRLKSATSLGNRVFLLKAWVGLGEAMKASSRTHVGDKALAAPGPQSLAAGILERLPRGPWAMAPRFPGQGSRAAASDALIRCTRVKAGLELASSSQALNLAPCLVGLHGVRGILGRGLKAALYS